MELFDAGLDILRLIVGVWAIEQSEKWDALVASCRGRGEAGHAFRWYGSWQCKLCVLGNSIWRHWQDRRALAEADKTFKVTRPCGCKDEE